ncbi:MAG TPA: type II secretion system protein [Candidatus Paceibacterota bacterium]|nr:type II secretion system protein [Candidatus Paceibacterota bacterium]
MAPRRGFTLLEVVISIFVVGVAATLAGTLLHVVPLARHTKYEDVALKVAANEIEMFRALGYESLPASGPIANPLLAGLPQGEGETTVIDYNDDTKEVTATVSWVAAVGQATSTVALTTLITNIGGLK